MKFWPFSAPMPFVIILATIVTLLAGFLPAHAQDIDQGYAVSGSHGGVAAGGATSTNIGLNTLIQGGNAFDATAATILALTEADPTKVHFGGEMPVIFYHAPTDEVIVLNGQGPAPELATFEFFDSIGGIPGTGRGVRNAAVPGIPLAVMALLRDYGTMTFEQVASPTQTLYAAHTGWKQNMAATLQRMIDADIAARANNGTREEGIQAAIDLFYKGAIADELIGWISANNGLMQKSDLVAYAESDLYEAPVSVDYKGYTVYKVGTWTGGPAMLEMLQLLDTYNLQGFGHNSADYTHTVVEAMKLGFADRDEYYADPNFVSVPVDILISDAYADMRRTLIDPNSASLEIEPGDPYALQALASTQRPIYGPIGANNDTSTSVVADHWGNVVVATPSGWGGTLAGDTGIYMGSRLVSFNVWDNHPNAIEPFKRPRITLTPSLVLQNGAPVIGISVAGGDAQDQAALQIFLNLVEFGLSAGDSVNTSSYPRFGTDHLTGSFSQPSPKLGSLYLNNTISSSIRDTLSTRGHVISSTSYWGRPSVITLNQDDSLIHAAGDGSAGRYAAAYSITGPNDPPVANDDASTTNEDTPVTISVLSNDSDPNDDSLDYTFVGSAANGSTSISGDSIVYMPELNFSGSDSFTYSISDNKGGNASANVTVTVAPLNDDPDAVDDTATTTTNTTISIDVLANDSDPENDSLMITAVSDPPNGVASTDGGSIFYTSDPGYVSADSMGYVDDPFLDSSAPGYAGGSIEPANGNIGGGAAIYLGGLDNTTVNDISGGWQQSFEAHPGQQVTLSFSYKLSMSSEYEADEYSQVMASIGSNLVMSGTNPYIERLTGDGNGGGEPETGWQQFTANVIVPVASSHNLVIGAYNNQKTLDNEWTKLLVDDVSVINMSTGASLLDVSFDGDDADYFTYTVDDGNGGSNTARVGVSVTPHTTTLAITLGWFLANPVADELVEVHWQTLAEFGTAGFNILVPSDNKLQQLNSELIPSTVIDSISPTDYSFRSRTDATHFYLQEMDTGGNVSQYGPFELGKASGIRRATWHEGMSSKLWLPVVME